MIEGSRKTTNVGKVYKYARGSVWWVKRECVEENGSVQSGLRPVVIVSNNERGRSDVVEVLTVTSQEKSEKYPKLNIPFTLEGRSSYVQCNQHFTVSIDKLHNYSGQLSDDVMHKVDRSLVYCQGLDHLCKEDSILVKSSDETSRSKLVSWTISEIEEFIQDVESSDYKTVMSKWNFDSEDHMIRTYSSLRKRLALRRLQDLYDCLCDDKFA